MKENMSDKKLGRGLSALFGESKMQKDLPTPGSGNNEANSVQLISINKIIAGIAIDPIGHRVPDQRVIPAS